MSQIKKKDTKEEYLEIVKTVKRAKKAAEKFIEENKKIDLQLERKFI